MPDLEKIQLPIFNVHMSQSTGEKSHFSLAEQGVVKVDEVCGMLDDYGYDGFVAPSVREGQKESKDILGKIINK